MRVGIIAPPWLPVPPPAYGGTEAVIDRLAAGLARKGHQVRLVANAASTCAVERHYTFDTVADIPIGSCMHEVGHALHAYELLDDVDVIHDHTVVGPLLAPRYAKGPVVTTNHGPFNSDTNPVYRAIAQSIPIIAISRSHAGSASDVPIAAVIHHGVDVGEFPVGQGRGGYLLYLGRMAPEKGPHRAARIARAVGIPLVIAAKMRESAELQFFESQVKPLLGSDVTYVGEATNREKQRLLADAIALVNPIRWREPFGMVMLEALACATPVVAFAEGAAPEIIDHGETGFLCGDEASMCRAIEQLGQIDRARCRQVAAERFSTDLMVDRHVAVYEDYVQSSRRARSQLARLATPMPRAGLEKTAPVLVLSDHQRR